MISIMAAAVFQIPFSGLDDLPVALWVVRVQVPPLRAYSRIASNHQERLAFGLSDTAAKGFVFFFEDHYILVCIRS